MKDRRQGGLKDVKRHAVMRSCGHIYSVFWIRMDSGSAVRCRDPTSAFCKLFFLRLSCSRSISGKWKMLWWPGPILVLLCFTLYPAKSEIENMTAMQEMQVYFGRGLLSANVRNEFTRTCKDYVGAIAFQFDLRLVPPFHSLFPSA